MSTTVLHVNLSVADINRLIRKLEKEETLIQKKIDQAVDELVETATNMAQDAFGGTATVEHHLEGEKRIIEATGENVIIMEFGAGLKTMEGHPLKNNAPVDVYKWSYSEQVGSGEGFRTGQWHFGGRVYTAVPPRHGMLDASDYIKNNLDSKMKEVFSR